MYKCQNPRALTFITLAWVFAGVDAFISDKNINIAWAIQFTHVNFWGFYSKGNLYNGSESILVGTDPWHLLLPVLIGCASTIFFHRLDGKFLGWHNKTINNIPDSLLLTLKNCCSGWTWWTKWKYHILIKFDFLFTAGVTRLLQVTFMFVHACSTWFWWQLKKDDCLYRNRFTLSTIICHWRPHLASALSTQKEI